MASPSNKKLLIFYVYNILKKYSDEQHPLKQQKIIDLIYSTYGMKCERKSVSDNILTLSEELDYDIITVPGKGVYLGARAFEESEASFLVDALFSSREISSTQARNLSGKVFADFSDYQQKRYNYIYKADRISRGDNRQLFYIIDELSRAIYEGKKVSFKYVSYTAEGKQYKDATVSPYYLINNNGKYYLVCSRREEWGLSNYRIEHMENICVTEENRPPIEQISGCERGFDIADYANENIYMFGGKSVRARIRLRNEKTLVYVYDWFGKDIAPKPTKDGIVVTVKANEQALLYWLLQYGEIAELISPADTRAKVKDMINNLAKLYADE